MSDDRAPGGAPGIVETFDQSSARGWVEVQTEGQPFRLDMAVDGIVVDSTWETQPEPRAGGREIRAFEFVIADLWDYLRPNNRISVLYDGRALPIAGHGMFRVPRHSGGRTPDELRERLNSGEAFTRSGELRLPHSVDAQWQAAALALYTRLRAALLGTVWEQLALMYGTLLGAVRDGGFIGHDVDFDCAYMSRFQDRAAAHELRKLAFSLLGKGFGVRATPSSIVVTEPERPDVRVKIFHVYADEHGMPHLPFGIAGTPQAQPWAWDAAIESELLGVSVLLPPHPEFLLEVIYGPNWRIQDKTFDWDARRTVAAVDGRLNAAEVEEVYWADFYARVSFDVGSSFCELMLSRSDLPSAVIDLGCGDGRDSFALARSGRGPVTGIDRSHIGLGHAQRKAAQLGLGNRLTFRVCDVSETEQLRTLVSAARPAGKPVLFYARFFLHSIPDDVQRTLLRVLAETARSGDCFAAEFRTERDEMEGKAHGDHYRRFQNGPAFGNALRDLYDFLPILEQEGNGFSPYRGEDPYLYRVIARRP